MRRRVRRKVPFLFIIMHAPRTICPSLTPSLIPSFPAQVRWGMRVRWVLRLSSPCPGGNIIIIILLSNQPPPPSLPPHLLRLPHTHLLITDAGRRRWTGARTLLVYVCVSLSVFAPLTFTADKKKRPSPLP